MMSKWQKMKNEWQHDKTNWASTQYDQSLRCPPEEAFGPWLSIKRTAKTLIRPDGCPGSSESSLDAHAIMLFFHAVAQIKTENNSELTGEQIQI